MRNWHVQYKEIIKIQVTSLCKVIKKIKFSRVRPTHNIRLNVVTNMIYSIFHICSERIMQEHK
jgi:hypothetical protein